MLSKRNVIRGNQDESSLSTREEKIMMLVVKVFS